MAENLPMHLTYLETVAFRKRIERAIEDEVASYLLANPGHSGEMVGHELVLILARLLARRGLDTAAVAELDRRVTELEDELVKLRAKP